MSHKNIGVGRKRKPLSLAKGELSGQSKILSKTLSSQGSALRTLLQPKDEKGATERGRKPAHRPETSGTIKMELRKNPKRKFKRSSSDATSSDDETETGMTLILDGQTLQDDSGGWSALGSDSRPSRKQSILALYEEMQPCTPKEASKILDISSAQLVSWLSESKKECRTKKEVVRNEKVTIKREPNKVTTYVDRSNGNQFIIVEDSGDEEKSLVERNDHKIWGDNAESKTRQKPNLLSRRANIVQEISDSSVIVPEGKTKEKRRRIRFWSVREKYELLRKYDAMEPCSQKFAADALGISTSAMSDLLNNRKNLETKFTNRILEEARILQMYDKLGSKVDAHVNLGVRADTLNKLLLRRDEIERDYEEFFPGMVVIEDEEILADGRDLELELLQWYRDEEKGGTEITWNQLKEKANELADQLNLIDFIPTDAWLIRWNKLHTVQKRPRSPANKTLAVYEGDEDANSDNGASNCLLAALRHFHPDDIFNLGESGLYYRAIPDHLILRDDWVTVLFACNMSGTEKKKLLVSGKSESPLCFSVLPLPLEYMYNDEACITREMITYYLQQWNSELASTNRHIALVLDYCSSHSGQRFDHIRFYYTSNDSANLPLNRGIISHTKSTYRRNMASSLLKFNSSGRLDEELSKRISIVDALFMLAESWTSLPKSTLISAFSTAFPLGHANPEENELEDDHLNEFDEDIRVHLDDDREERIISQRVITTIHRPDNNVSDDDQAEIVGETIVHAEGTVCLTEDETNDFDLDNFISTESPPETPKGQILEINLSGGRRLATAPGVQAPPKRNEDSPPSVNEVKDALSTIKRFLQSNGGTLEDLTDYTQLESKVLSKLPVWCAR